MKLTDAQLARIQAWRRRVVRLWLLTMGAALLVWAASAAFNLAAPVQVALATVLAALIFASVATTRRGRCPNCGERIRFAPRIELPPCCSRCRADFYGS